MKRILVIDDDPMIRIVIRAGLEDEGYEIFELESGTHALDTITSQAIDLVILDILMDGKEGIETITDIRKISRNLPVIVMSSSSLYLDCAMDLGANHAINKPIKLNDLSLKVRELLK